MNRYLTGALVWWVVGFVAGAVGCRAAEEDPSPAWNVRVITISAPEAVTARAAMFTAAQQDQPLFAQMAELVASGGAEIVSDTLTRCATGRCKASALVETPFPTDFSVDTKWRHLIPHSFSFKNVGCFVETEIEQRAGQPATLNLTWERVRYRGRKSFPMISVQTFSQLELPIFFFEKISAKLPLVSGRWRLTGMTRPMIAEGEPMEPQRTLMTFVRAVDMKSTTPAAGASGAHRVHLCVFRVPMTEGLNMARRDPDDDAALFERLLERTQNKEIALANHAACLTGLAGHGKAEATHEFAWPAEYTPDPGSIQFLNAGHALTATTSDGREGEAGGMHVEWDSIIGDVRMVPLTPHPQGASMVCPERFGELLDLRVPAEPGTARFAGAMLLPDDGGSRMMDVCFLAYAGPAKKGAGLRPARTEVHTGVISLEAAEGARLARHVDDIAWEDIDTLLKRNAARVVAWMAIAGKAATEAKAVVSNEVPCVPVIKVLRHPGGLVYPAAAMFVGVDSSLQLRLPGTAAAFAGSLKVSFVKPELPPLSAFMAAADSGEELPNFIPAITAFPAAGEKMPPLDFDHPQIVSLTPCDAKPGHAEHGRWHMVVLCLRRG